MCFSKLFKKGETNMQYTEKLELNLPEDDDYIESTSREALNDNFEVLDENVIVKDDFAIVSGTVTIPAGSLHGRSNATSFSYPTGFTKDNCVLLQIDKHREAQTSHAYGETYFNNWSVAGSSGALPHIIVFHDDGFSVRLAMVDADTDYSSDTDITIYVRLVLMKIPTD